MKQEILLLSARKGFNDNQTWITYLPYNYKTIYDKTDKFVGLKLYKFEDRFKIRVDKNIIDLLECTDFLQKCIVEYEIVNKGTFKDLYKFTKLTIGNKVINLI